MLNETKEIILQSFFRSAAPAAGCGTSGGEAQHQSLRDIVSSLPTLRSTQNVLQNTIQRILSEAKSELYLIIDPSHTHLILSYLFPST